MTIHIPLSGASYGEKPERRSAGLPESFDYVPREMRRRRTPTPPPSPNSSPAAEDRSRGRIVPRSARNAAGAELGPLAVDPWGKGVWWRGGPHKVDTIRRRIKAANGVAMRNGLALRMLPSGHQMADLSDPVFSARKWRRLRKDLICLAHRLQTIDTRG